MGIALLPPIWAVLAPYIGVSTGAVALICAGLYSTNGNKLEDGLKIMIGFWCGDLWALLALKLMNVINLNPDLELFVILAIFGFLAVVIGSILEKIIFLPAWLCGWAIGLTIMSSMDVSNLSGIFIQIAVAMAAGVWYVGAGADLFSRCILRKLEK